MSVNFSLSKDWVAYPISDLLENSADEITPRAIALATPVFALGDATVHLLNALYKTGQVALAYFGYLQVAPEVAGEILDHLKQAVWFIGLAILGAPLGILYPSLLIECFFREVEPEIIFGEVEPEINDAIDNARWNSIELSDRLKNESLYRKKLGKLLDSHVIPELTKIITSYIPRADVFGIDAWQTYFGVDVGAEPPLPKDIDQILQAPSHIDPAKPDRTVADDFMLVLIPKEFTKGGKKVPLSLNSLGELVQHLPNQPTKYRYFWKAAQDEHGSTPAEDAHWVLMSRDVLQASRYRSYDVQKTQVENFSKQTDIPYEVPTALEAATCIFAEYARTGTRLYGDNPWTYTRCQESTQGFQLVVGGFAPGGLGVRSFYGDANFGVALLRKVPKALGT